VAYSLRLDPAAGDTFTLDQFKRDIASLTWS